MRTHLLMLSFTILTFLTGTSQKLKAAMLDDANTTITLRNFYMLRDYHQEDAGQSQAGSWSQAVLARFDSGFSDGPLAFGLSATGLYAIRLDGGAGRSNDGNLPFDDYDRSPARDYGRAGLTARLRYGASSVKVGLIEPRLPVLFQDDVRVLPQTFEGALIESNFLGGTRLVGGQFWRTSTRASSDSEPFYLAGRPASESSNKLSTVGLEARVSDFNISGYFANLENIYDQQYFGSTFNHRLNASLSLFGTLSYFSNKQSGRALSGEIDNRAYGLRLGIRYLGHSISLTNQRMLGDSMFPMLAGSTPQPYLVNWVTNGGFFWANERSWQIRYDYDFVQLGIPGLTLMSRYTKGVDIDYGSTTRGHEFERDTDLGYTVQSGAVKDLNITLRTSSVRSSYSSDYDEVRVIVSLPIHF